MGAAMMGMTTPGLDVNMEMFGLRMNNQLLIPGVTVMRVRNPLVGARAGSAPGAAVAVRAANVNIDLCIAVLLSAADGRRRGRRSDLYHACHKLARLPQKFADQELPTVINVLVMRDNLTLDDWTLDALRARRPLADLLLSFLDDANPLADGRGRTSSLDKPSADPVDGGRRGAGRGRTIYNAGAQPLEIRASARLSDSLDIAVADALLNPPGRHRADASRPLYAHFPDVDWAG